MDCPVFLADQEVVQGIVSPWRGRVLDTLDVVASMRPKWIRLTRSCGLREGVDGTRGLVDGGVGDGRIVVQGQPPRSAGNDVRQRKEDSTLAECRKWGPRLVPVMPPPVRRARKPSRSSMLVTQYVATPMGWPIPQRTSVAGRSACRRSLVRASLAASDGPGRGRGCVAARGRPGWRMATGIGTFLRMQSRRGRGHGRRRSVALRRVPGHGSRPARRPPRPGGHEPCT